MVDLSFWNLLSFDSFAHLGVFAVLACSMLVGFVKQYSFPTLRYHPYWWVLVIGLIYGGFVESIHVLISDRHASWIDLISNLIGCVVGLALFYAVYGRLSDRTAVMNRSYL